MEESRAVTLQLHEVVRVRAAQVGGYVAELHAESVSVYFGFPKSQEHAEERACTLALAVVEDAAQLGGQAGAPAVAGGAVTIHAGIHAAVSLIGSLAGEGEGEAARPVAQGEAPNIARQLQGLARPNEVLMSAVVRDKASSRFAIEPRATAGGAHVVLRGRELPVFALRGALSQQLSLGAALGAWRSS